MESEFNPFFSTAFSSTLFLARRRPSFSAVSVADGLFLSVCLRFRRDSCFRQRHPLGPHRREISTEVPAGNQRSRLRLPRLRQRWLDGYLSGQQWQMRFLHSVSTSAE